MRVLEELVKKDSSFLKKRSKRLLFFQQLCGGWPWPGSLGGRRHKSFLVLFFKKELLSYFVQRAVYRPAPGWASPCWTGEP
jgi:hypothetical protein